MNSQEIQYLVHICRTSVLNDLRGNKEKDEKTIFKIRKIQVNESNQYSKF